jgi:hypothetical protein
VCTGILVHYEQTVSGPARSEVTLGLHCGVVLQCQVHQPSVHRRQPVVRAGPEIREWAPRRFDKRERINHAMRARLMLTSAALVAVD